MRRHTQKMTRTFKVTAYLVLSTVLLPLHPAVGNALYDCRMSGQKNLPACCCDTRAVAVSSCEPGADRCDAIPPPGGPGLTTDSCCDIHFTSSSPSVVAKLSLERGAPEANAPAINATAASDPHAVATATLKRHIPPLKPPPVYLTDCCFRL